MVITMKKSIPLFIFLLFAAQVCQAELKIGYVNIGKILEKSPQLEKVRSKLEAEFSGRAKQLESKIKDIKAMEDKFNRDSAVMGDEERRRLERDLIEKKRDTARTQQEFQEDTNLRKNEELGIVERRILEIIRALAKEESFDLLLADGVLYANDQIDVTSRVMQKLETSPQ
jgi:outer membrane protein